MNKKFGICVEGVSPSKMRKYGDLIKVARKSKRRIKDKKLSQIKYEDNNILSQFPDKFIPSLVEDLINISLATFAADCSVIRDSYIPKKTMSEEGRFFSRKIHLTIPVSDKEKWNSLKLLLEKTVSFMTYDVFTSFGGSFYINEKNNPLFISINHGGGMQKFLEKVYSLSTVKSNKLIIGFNKKGSLESTQFSRSLVYLSMATSIAIGNSVNKIFIPENGIIANQIGLNSDRFATKTVHPIFLNYFTNLISKLFCQKFEIINPFNYLTKGEVVKLIKNKKGIKETVSCSRARKFNPSKYCGMCMPCILRIVSLTSSDVNNDRKISNHGINPFLINLDKPDLKDNISFPNKFTRDFYGGAIINLLSLIKFADELQNYSKKKLLSKYYEFYDEELFKMYIRFSIEIIKTLEYFSHKNPSLKNRIPKIKRNF
jgi:7-cyano-7-deazaguanine synthase in queuosine biosynthesis